MCAVIVTCEQIIFSDRSKHARTAKLSPRSNHHHDHHHHHHHQDPDVINGVHHHHHYHHEDPDIENGFTYPELENVNKIPNSFKLMLNNSLCGHGGDFCSEPISYPMRTITKALNKQKSLVSSMFENYVSVQTRSGLAADSQMENVCSMTTTHIMPKAAKNKKGQFKFLVNGGEGAEEYIQLVQISQCTRVRESCGHGNTFAREVTECRQEFTDHKLVALDEAGKELVIDTFSFPSCCFCYMHVGKEF